MVCYSNLQVKVTMEIFGMIVSESKEINHHHQFSQGRLESYKGYVNPSMCIIGPAFHL